MEIFPKYRHSAINIQEVWKENRRLEAETYLSDGYEIRKEIKSKHKFLLFGEIANVSQPNRLKGIVTSEFHGVPFLKATQMLRSRPKVRKWLVEDLIPGKSGRYVREGIILISCSGTVGLTSIALARHEGIIITHDLMRVVPNDKDWRGYIYAYLRTDDAKKMLRSSKYGNVIKHLEVAHILSLIHI